jgi:hypothetical protein
MDQTHFGFDKVSVLAKAKEFTKTGGWRLTVKSSAAALLPFALLLKGISNLLPKR